MTLRIGIVGARRARQGLGPFVARWLRELGADVVAFSCTSESSVAVAADELARIAAVEPRGYVGERSMFAAEELDAAVVLSPPEHHLDGVRAALERGLHVLCEKPLFLPAREGVEQAAELAAAFAERGLVLDENCQWPHVLPSFRALFPNTPAVPNRFAMGMQPASSGADMWTDALSHPLSLLQALLGDALELEDPSVPAWDDSSRAVRVGFTAHGPRGALVAQVELETVPQQPRTAWLELDGQRALRWVRPSDYAIFLRAVGPGGQREAQVPDPLEAHLAAFLARTKNPPPMGAAPEPALPARAAALAALLDATESARS